MNTYVPINFGELYRIGATQREAVDKAANEFTNTITTFGQFQSPSAVDTQNYYNASIGQVKDLIEEAATNPDAMKDANFRSRLQSRINNLDYSNLSNFRQSAENLKARQQMIARMQAAGKYNENWDDIDITNWNTSQQGIMNNLAPVEYMNANELSQKYFDNLRPGSLGDVWKNGIKYNVTGNNMNDLLAVAKAHQNDLINTPQGQKYYEQFLKQYEGDEAKASEAFTDMIAQSHIDRTLRPQLTPDPMFMEQLRNSYRSAGSVEIEKKLPTRLDFINESIQKSTNKAIGIDNIRDYRNDVERIANAYGKDNEVSKNAANRLKRVDGYIKDLEESSALYEQYAKAYRATGDERYLLAAQQAERIATQRQMQLQGMAQSDVMLRQFKEASGFDAFNKSKSSGYSTKGYINGVKRAIDAVKAEIPVGDTDGLLTELRGLPELITDEDGGKQQAYQFSDSRGFVLPETIFVAATKTSPREVKRDAGWLGDDRFPLKEAIESGNINSVSFIPDNGVVQIGNNKVLTGKIRIPKTEVQNKLGKGTYAGLGVLAAPLTGKAPTSAAIRDLFGGREVKQLVGKDGIEYFEIDGMRKLPSEEVAPAYWQNINQHYQQGKKYGGIGGASQASKAYGESAEQTLGQ